MSYPFPEPNPRDLARLADVVEITDELLQLIRKKDPQHDCYVTYDALLFALRYLMKLWHLDFSDMIFLDCMANISGPALVASLFGFHEVHSIELFNDGADFSMQLADRYARSGAKCFIGVGRFQEQFVVNSNMVYLNSLILGDVMDEGRAIHSFLRCAESTLRGTYIILLSKYDRYEISHFSIEVLIQKKYAEGMNDEAVLSVCRKL